MRPLFPRLMVPALLLISPAQAPGAGLGEPANARTAWLYRVLGKNGSFRKTTGKTWTETTIEGSRFHFQESSRQARYVEIFDPSRTMWVRLFDHHAEWRQGKNPTWNRLYDGRWVSPAELPADPPDDYRIRLAYFVPTDRRPVADYAARIRVVMDVVAEIYRQDFAARKIRSKGLRFETRNGEAVVHLVRGRGTAAFYNKGPNYDPRNQWNLILPEIPRAVGQPTRNVIVVFTETYDLGPARFEWPGGVAYGARFSAEGGVGLFSSWILRPELCATTVPRQLQWLFDTTPIKGRTALGHGRIDSPRFEFIEDGFGAVAHELGHALGLPHDNRQDDRNIMGNGFRNLRRNFAAGADPARRVRFSDDNARIFYASRYLAPDAVLADRLPPSVQLRFVGPLKQGATSIRVSVTAADDAGLRAISFFSPVQDSVVGGKALYGRRQSFELSLPVQPLKTGEFRLQAITADVGGNLTTRDFVSPVTR